LIAKIEGCEETHEYMKREGLSKRGVNIENYYRLNVEVGVGEFGMNEWNRLADISTNTRRYLGKTEVKRMNDEAAHKLGKISRAIRRTQRDSMLSGGGSGDYKGLADVPEAYPMAVELPAEVPLQPPGSPPPRPSYESGHRDTLEVPFGNRLPLEQHSPRSSTSNDSIADRLTVHSPTPNQWANVSGADKIPVVSEEQKRKSPSRVEPPPLPPKTPIPGQARQRPTAPYPIDDGPPPVANMARKPDYRGR